LDLTGGL